MADVQPLEALHYDQAKAGPLQQLVAPPYDVIDPEQRAELAARSPYNVVHVDLPTGDDPYENAARTFARSDGLGRRESVARNSSSTIVSSAAFAVISCPKRPSVALNRFWIPSAFCR